MAVEPIRVEGLRELSRNLRRMDRDLPKGLRVAANKAAQIVVDDAKPRVPSRTGKAKRSIKVASTRTMTRVSAGGNRAPYYPWLDFGGKVGRNRSVHRPFLREGRYIWKSFADHRDQVEETLRDELDQVARSAGVELS